MSISATFGSDYHLPALAAHVEGGPATKKGEGGVLSDILLELHTALIEANSE